MENAYTRIFNPIAFDKKVKLINRKKKLEGALVFLEQQKEKAQKSGNKVLLESILTLIVFHKDRLKRGAYRHGSNH